MNFKLAERLNLKRNEDVIISSINGHESRFKVIPTDSVGENQLFAPIHYMETNFLTPSVFDEYSKEPSYKCTAVRIKKFKTRG